MRRASLHAPDHAEPDTHICALTPESGFSVMLEGDHWFVWIILAGVVKLWGCDSLDNVLDTLRSQEGSLRHAWQAEERQDDFAAAWQKALQQVEARFAPARRLRIDERLKRQLLWAFNAGGEVDADRLLTILQHEGVTLSPEELITLVGEMMSGLRMAIRSWRPGLN